MQKLSAPESFLLSTFLTPREPESLPVMTKEEWALCLGVPAHEAIENLKRQSLLESSSLPLRLERKLPKKELEAMADSLGLPKKGTKGDLSVRLVQNDRELVEAGIDGFELLQCTEDGRRLAENYLREVASGDTSERAANGLDARHMKAAALWFAAAASGGVVGNSADRLVEKLLSSLSSTSPEEDGGKPANSASENSLSRLSEDEKEQYYAVYRLPAVIFLRFCYECFLNGEDAPGLSGTAVGTGAGENGGMRALDSSYFCSKFIVLSLNDGSWGGQEIYHVFVDKPDRILVAWVYERGGRGSNDYELRGFWEHELDQSQARSLEGDIRDFLDDLVHAM